MGLPALPTQDSKNISHVTSVQYPTTWLHGTKKSQNLEKPDQEWTETDFFPFATFVLEVQIEFRKQSLIHRRGRGFVDFGTKYKPLMVPSFHKNITAKLNFVYHGLSFQLHLTDLVPFIFLFCQKSFHKSLPYLYI